MLYSRLVREFTKNKVKNENATKLRFVDLFCGIGGFHIAASQCFDGECVFACDKDKNVAKVYEDNFGFNPICDITQLVTSELPDFDFLFAGFPCQPFSKGGSQKGFIDKVRGTLFFDIIRIIEFKRPKFILLENVQNIVNHDGGRTYSIIVQTIKSLGYTIPSKPIILSPHNLGIPVNRPRFFLPCILEYKNKLGDLVFDFPDEVIIDNNHLLKNFNFDQDFDVNLEINEYEKLVLDMWDDFYRGIDVKVLGFPVWFDYFRYEGPIDDYPVWKQNFIMKNKSLYIRNKKFIDNWICKYENLEWIKNSSHRRFEWQCGEFYDTVYQGLIQFRPSGIRVKKMNVFSTLVAMNQPQIVGPLKRRLSVGETLRLQSFPRSFKFNVSRNTALRQLGNSVNVEVVKYIINWMINYEKRK